MQARRTHQVVDDVELVVLPVAGVDPAVLLLPHVVLEQAPVPEGPLAVQALQAAGTGGQGLRRPGSRLLTLQSRMFILGHSAPSTGTRPLADPRFKCLTRQDACLFLHLLSWLFS